MTGTEVRDAIAAERRELAAVLHGLPAAAWEAPTLCAGWRPREVVAHITMPFRYSRSQVVWQLVRARGDFNRMADRCARQDAAALPVSDLVAALERNAGHPWKPPGGGFEGALSHDVIHGLDITVALGLDRTVPRDRLRIVLGAITPRRVAYFRAELAGVELRADDLEWSFGSGTPVSGAGQDLLLVLCGRKLPAGRLRGTPSQRFTRA